MNFNIYLRYSIVTLPDQQCLFSKLVNVSNKTRKHTPFEGISETERFVQLTIHQGSSHNPQVQGHGFRKQEEGQREENNHRKAGN